MVDIQPFKGLRYDPKFAGDNSLNICPPFDAITPDLQKVYMKDQISIL